MIIQGTEHISPLRHQAGQCGKATSCGRIDISNQASFSLSATAAKHLAGHYAALPITCRLCSHGLVLRRGLRCRMGGAGLLLRGAGIRWRRLAWRRGRRSAYRLPGGAVAEGHLQAREREGRQAQDRPVQNRHTRRLDEHHSHGSIDNSPPAQPGEYCSAYACMRRHAVSSKPQHDRRCMVDIGGWMC